MENETTDEILTGMIEVFAEHSVLLGKSIAVLEELADEVSKLPSRRYASLLAAGDVVALVLSIAAFIVAVFR